MFDKLLTALRTAVASLIERIRIHKEHEIKGAFKTLQDRGIKIKDYKETDGAGRTILS